MLDQGFTTAEMAEMFTPAARVGAIIEFEAALALALADTGLVDTATAEIVAEACREPVEDPEAVLATTWSEGTPLPALLDNIRSRLSDDEARWVHYGTTTQDAVDTGTMLLASRGLEILDSGLLAAAGEMARLVAAHRDQPQMGRTFLQHARPTTFGFTAAGWLDATLGHLTDLRQQRSKLVVQLGGPVGNLSEYGEKGVEVTEALATRLGLAAPAIAWHSDRSRIAGLAAALEGTARTMARVGIDVALLASTDIGEITVRGGRSSSMAGKQNPMDSVRAVAAAEICTAAAQVITAGRLTEMERGIGGWHAEWGALPLVFQGTAAAVEAMTDCLASLQVRSDTMGGRVKSEAQIDPRLIDRILANYEAVSK
jgi:3-carboxy-cis,cis-muconate cycloisomerase